MSIVQGKPPLSLRDVVGMGARAGVIAACNGKTRQAQIQKLLEILGAYEYPDSADILQLYIAYQVARGHINQNVGRVLLEDIRRITSIVSGAEGEELLRKYLGAVKWAFTAVDRGRFRHVCKRLRGLKPSVDDIIKLMFNIQ